MIKHAYFKALLFILAEVIIHNCGGNQKFFILPGKTVISSSLIIIFYSSNLSISGMPFFSGLHSKDAITDIILLIRYFPLFPIFSYFCFILNNYNLFYSYSILILLLLMSNKFIIRLIRHFNKMFISTLWIPYLISCIWEEIIIWDFGFVFLTIYMQITQKYSLLYFR